MLITKFKELENLNIAISRNLKVIMELWIHSFGLGRDNILKFCSLFQ